MDAKNAVRLAKDHVLDLFSDEKPMNVGLEELELDDDGFWKVTVGFSRPWDTASKNAFTVLVETAPLRRTYKLIQIDDQSGRVVSVKNRGTAS